MKFWFGRKAANKSFDLDELISRMCLRDSLLGSKSSISWSAHREAERLSDPEIIQAVIFYLKKGRSADERRSAYFVLGKVGKNLSSKEAAKQLLLFASSEVDDFALSIVLSMISELSLNDDEDISHIVGLLRDKRWSVRHAAIDALKASRSRYAEEELITLLEETNDGNDKIHCHAALGEIGTERSLQAIQVNTKSRKRDIKISAILALESIQMRVDARLS